MHKFINSITLTDGLVEHATFSSIASDDLPFSGVAAGQYSNPTITVDQWGRIVLAVNGSGGGSLAIGSPISSGRADGSVLYEDAAGNLAISPTAGFFFSPADPGVPTNDILHIGSAAGVGSGELQIYDPGQGAYISFASNGNSLTITDGTNPTDLNIGNFNAVDGFFSGNVFALTAWLTDSASSAVRLKVQQYTAGTQVNDLTQWLSSVGLTFTRIDRDGYFMTRKVAAPADARLANSEVALWTDDTSTAAGFCLKGKDSGGNVWTDSMLTLKLAGTTQRSFTTPAANTVSTKLLVDLFDPGSFNQIVAIGLPSGAAASARAMSLFDNRSSGHQPTLVVFSPDENQYAGPMWDGTNNKSTYFSTKPFTLSLYTSVVHVNSFITRYDAGTDTTSCRIVLSDDTNEPAIGGVIFDHYATVGTTSTNGTEDDLYSDTVLAYTIRTPGRKITAEYVLDVAAHATATRRIRAYFAGTAVVDSGTLTFPSGGTVVVRVSLICEDATTIRAWAELIVSGITLQPIITYTRLTGLTLSGTNVLKLTGVATGVGAASGDINARAGYVEWKPQY